jgi:hypothetical protein
MCFDYIGEVSQFRLDLVCSDHRSQSKQRGTYVHFKHGSYQRLIVNRISLPRGDEDKSAAEIPLLVLVMTRGVSRCIGAEIGVQPERLREGET